MAEWEEGKNPLLNELVIDNIAKYLSFEELKACRRLNHLWKKTTNKIFLKRRPPLQIISSPSEKDQIMAIAQFMEIYSDPSHPHPHAQLVRQYRNFEVVGLDKKECIPIFYNFITAVGHQMTSLKLNDIYVLRNSQDLADIVSSKYSPKLEELHLYNLNHSYNQQRDCEKVCIDGKENKHLRRLSICHAYNDNYEKIQWVNVVSRYPKLKALSLDYIYADVFEEIATALVTIRKANETKLKLTELKISHFIKTGDTEAKRKAWWQRIWDLLKTANLPLEKLTLDGSTIAISSALIQQYRESLKSLSLRDIIPKPFPLMKALEEMGVEQCWDLTFLTKVPNLKLLCFHPYREYSSLTCFPKSTPNPLLSLTKLHTGSWKEWNVSLMEQLLLWMPNVQNLEMHLNNTTFSWICQHWPNLKELTVRGGELDDSGVVGEFDEALEVEGCRVNITNLKALVTFKMVDINSGTKGLTEKSVFYGFSLMPKLSKLTLRVKSELSAEAMLALNRGMTNVQIKVANEL